MKVEASKASIANAADPRRVEEWDPLLKRLNELANPRPATPAHTPAPAQPRATKFTAPPAGGKFEDVVEQVSVTSRSLKSRLSASPKLTSIPNLKIMNTNRNTPGGEEHRDEGARCQL